MEEPRTIVAAGCRSIPLEGSDHRGQVGGAGCPALSGCSQKSILRLFQTNNRRLVSMTAESNRSSRPCRAAYPLLRPAEADFVGPPLPPQGFSKDFNVLDEDHHGSLFLLDVVWLFVEPLFWSALAFALIALALKGRGALEAARRAAGESRITLSLYVPTCCWWAHHLPWRLESSLGRSIATPLLVTPDWIWASLGPGVALALTVFVGDFTSYWRHRLEHTRWLWPTHAIHHSDTEMTWLTGNRFHPVNRLVTTVVDNIVLAMLGAPPWTIAANELIRHYYGEFVHADLPWTYGPLGAIFVSPAMHRWHHAREVTGSGSNFATVFSIFDRLFGTLHLPGPCRVPLGVTDDIGRGAMGQLCLSVQELGEGRFRSQRSGKSARRSLAASTHDTNPEAAGPWEDWIVKLSVVIPAYQRTPYAFARSSTAFVPFTLPLDG